MIPTVSAVAYEAARHRAAVLDRSDRGRIIVTGADRGSYLHGLFTNDIAGLKAGQGCYAAYLTAQGRLISDMHVYELGDAILLSLPGDTKDAVLAKLDQFIFTEDVQLGDVGTTFAQIAVIGPAAAAAIAAALGADAAAPLDAMPMHGNARVQWNGDPAILVRIDDAGEAGYDVFVETARADALKAALTASGVVPIDAETADAIRIESGVPLFHRDMDEDTIPLEAGIEPRAISFVGQEVIIRVMHRGHGRVARKLVGLTMEGDRVPATGAAIHAADREIGRVTSATRSPALDRPIALGYVHRDFVAPGTEVRVDGASARVTAVPFV
jgi:glycine cleavage system aminomethyltransferase T